MSDCSHLAGIQQVTPSADGCEDCLRIGGQWLHLRLCLTCGHVGCCDESPNRHATAHFHSSGHPMIRSFEPGEDMAVVLRRPARVRASLNPARDDTLRIVDAPDRQRYEARLGGAVVGFVDYRAVRGRWILVHTEVDPSVEGQGIGSRLVTGVLDDIRARDIRVTVKCPFVAAFLERHPDYRDLLARPPAIRNREPSG